MKLVSDDYLAHHGIEGMKWGRRNGPPYPLGSGQKSSAEKRAERKAATKSLNDLYRAAARPKYNYSTNQQRAIKLAKKKSTLETKGKNTEKVDEKLTAARSEMDKAQREISDISNRINHIISDAEKNGYVVNSKPVMRSAATGKDAVIAFAQAMANTAMINIMTEPFWNNRRW